MLGQLCVCSEVTGRNTIQGGAVRMTDTATGL